MHSSKKILRFTGMACVAVMTLGLTGCGRSITNGPSSAHDADNLEKWVAGIKSQKPKPKTDPLPVLDPVKVFSYREHMTNVTLPTPTMPTPTMPTPTMPTPTMPAQTQPPQASNDVATEIEIEISGPAISEKESTGELNTPANANSGATGTESTATAVTAAPAQALNATTLRNPFGIPAGIANVAGEVAAQGPRPDTSRTKQPLEAFELDSLKMVGTLGPGGRTGLVMTPDKVTHRVSIGEYMGLHDGRVVDVTPDEITLVELVPGGQNGWVERSASLQMP